MQRPDRAIVTWPGGLKSKPSVQGLGYHTHVNEDGPYRVLEAIIPSFCCTDASLNPASTSVFVRLKVGSNYFSTDCLRGTIAVQILLVG